MKLELFGAELTEDDRILFRNIEDKIRQSEKQFTPKFTFFLDERSCALVEKAFADSNFDNYFLYGGYDSASRKILSVAPPYSYANFPEFPIAALKISYRKTDTVTHRNVLGSLMGLNIERKTVGDIICSEGETVVFVVEQVADTVLSELKKIGKVGVKVALCHDPPQIAEQSYESIETTVASLRLDCVVSAVTGLSREKSAQLIKNGKVAVNYVEQSSVSSQLECGAKFSVRGYGKFILGSVNGVSKKNRIHITIKKFV